MLKRKYAIQMKKVLSLLMMILVISWAFSVTVSAKNNSSKLDEKLTLALQDLSVDENVKVLVNHDGVLTDDKLEELIYNVCRLTEDTIKVDHSLFPTEEDALAAEEKNLKLWTAAKEMVIPRFYTDSNLSAIKAILEDDSSVEFFSLSSACFAVSLSNSQIEEISKSEKVKGINLYSEKENRPNDTMDYGCHTKFAEFYEESKGEFGGDFWQNYSEGYKYYRNGDTSESPYFIQVFACDQPENSLESAIFGNYCVTGDLTYPYHLGVYIYTLNDQKIYTLYEAYEQGVEGIEVMFEEDAMYPDLVKKLGDVDKDSRVTIKDVTLIQKSLAGLAEIKNNVISGISQENCYPKEAYTQYYSDFNHDLKTDIRDATAIQKYLVGLEY